VSRQDLIEARSAKLVAGFDRYVRAYDEMVPFTGEQLAAHRKTIALRRRAGSVRTAAESEQFVASLRETLLAWGIGRRASRLVGVTEFAVALRNVVPRLEPLESLTIDAANTSCDIAERLWKIVDSLGVVENKAKVVAGTKTLHHLLPDLVPPMDRAWTGFFFNFHLPEWQDPTSQRRIFQLAYTQFTSIAKQVDPERYVTNAGWRTSRTKILDNAVIGFGKTELGEPPRITEEPANQVSFEVQGYPPAKSEALSMLGAGHGHAPRVRLLLEAARYACAAQDFQPITSANVGLDVALYSPAGQNPADATNYLGGIGDVLEDKTRRGQLAHLGDFAAVWLYRNDLQIKEVTYRELHADHVSYTVTVREVAN
jgi:hypothetical protein